MLDYRETGRRAAWWSCLYLHHKPDASNPPSTPRDQACYLHRSTFLRLESAIESCAATKNLPVLFLEPRLRMSPTGSIVHLTPG
jgi:hypothetical protein